MWTRGKRLWQRFKMWRAQKCQSHDSVDLCLPFCRITLERKSKLPIAHELQVVVPRLEVREIITQNGTSIRLEREVIMSSVTVVSSPRREQSPIRLAKETKGKSDK